MAQKAANAEETAGQDEAEGPLLDGVVAAVKRLIARGKERGYITYDELNGALPGDQVSSEQIEDTMAMLSELGINLVEGDESEEAEPADHPRDHRLARSAQSQQDATARHHRSGRQLWRLARPDAGDRRCRCHPR